MTYAVYLASERDDLYEKKAATQKKAGTSMCEERRNASEQRQSKTWEERQRRKAWEERERPAAAAGAVAGMASARASPMLPMLPIVVALSFTTARTALPHPSLTVSLILIAK